MSCSQNPVNIKPTKQICREECSYEFDYNPNSSAIVTNMGNYLEINVDGKNVICVPVFLDLPIALRGALASPFLNSM